MDLLQRLRLALAERYTIELELGRGGWSVVYLAWDKKAERPVAIKALRPELFPTLGHDRFLNEIRLVAQFNHPYILALHDWGAVEQDLLYYVMPMEGESLRDRMVREGRLAVPDALQVAREVAEALQYAHERGVVHRDIKPENILFKAGHAVVSDFGIAGAISAADEARLSGTDVVLGTPEYMSPEQARRGPLDGRSDIYSLGVTIYEALTGELPRLDVGASLKTLERLRPDVPRAVVQALRRALAAEPENRFDTGSAFARGLAKTGSQWLPALVAASVALPLIVWRMFADAGPPVDSDRFVIMPFVHTQGAQPALIDGELCARLLYHSFAQWADVRVTEPLRLSDALQRMAGDEERRQFDLATGLDIARLVGAGKLVRGELWAFEDTTYLMASVHDVTRRGRQMKSHIVRLGPGASETLALQDLADSILFAGTRAPPGPPHVRLTTSTRALLAHEEGHKALDRWDLEKAAGAFRRAIVLDTGFAHAFLELAQVKAWQGLAAERWRDTAARAVALGERLTPRERLLAGAIEATGWRRQDEACVLYRRLVARDSLDATAWYGLAECQVEDGVVVRDPSSPSGWRFRASYHAATLSYRRAIALAPSLLLRGQVYARLTGWLYVEPHRIRMGRPLPPDTGLFAAYAGLERDTFVFVPYPVQRMVNHTMPRTSVAAANLRGRELLGEIVNAWVDAFPNSAEAHEAKAEWLEGLGRLGAHGGGQETALAEIREARRLVASSNLTARPSVAVAEIRILLKLRDFSGARRVADSVLDVGARGDPESAEALAGIAALTGRGGRAAEMLKQAAPRLYSGFQSLGFGGAPQPVLEAASQLHAHAAVGGPVDSVAVHVRRLDSLLSAWLTPQRLTAARELLWQEMMLSFPIIGPTALHRTGAPSLRVRMQANLARGDSTSVREFLRRRSSRSGAIPAAQASIDAVYHEALAFLALGDSTQARGHLDDWLGGLQLARRSLVWQAAQAGTFVRAMALRAELAARQGDRATARYWAQAVIALWSDADPGLRPLVARMREI